MKNIVLIVLVLSAINVQAQTASANEDLLTSYKWIEVVRIQECKIDGTPIDNEYVLTLVNQQFNVISMTSDEKNAIIKILDYTQGGLDKEGIETTNLFKVYNYRGNENNIEEDDKNAASRDDDLQRYFLVPVKLLKSSAIKTEIVKGQLSLGVIYFPFKYRPQKGKQDFSGAFNFGAAAAYTFRHQVSSKWTVSVLSGYSISNVNIDSASAGKNTNLLTTVNNFTALSFSGGVLLQYEEKVQAGVFIGTDLISNRNQKTFDWAYQGKPWLSIGFGVSIFTVDNDVVKATSSQQQSAKHIGKNTH